MPKIQLQNTTSQPFEFTEYHDVVCARRGQCNCAIRRSMGPKGKEVSQRLPRSFRVGPKGPNGLSVPVDREVLYIDHVASLVKAGKLVVLAAPDLSVEPVKES